jgi:hypothetical protein
VSKRLNLVDTSVGIDHFSTASRIGTSLTSRMSKKNPTATDLARDTIDAIHASKYKAFRERYPKLELYNEEAEKKCISEQEKSDYRERTKRSKQAFDDLVKSAREARDSVDPSTAYNGQGIIDWARAPRVEKGDKTGTWQLDRESTCMRMVASTCLSHKLRNICGYDRLPS